MEPMIWTREGLSIWEWRELPLKKKIEILRKHGFKMDKPRPQAPPVSGSYLLDAYYKHVAEDHAIHLNCPYAVLSCGHNP